MVKKGDTLIEVTLAIGIFSLVAIAVVSVVNSSTSGAQTALETTLSREGIDTQAEALRFIQSSYINSKTFDEPINNSNDQNLKYKILWQRIKEIAQKPDGLDLIYQPSTCQSLYAPSDPGNISSPSRVETEHAFVIDPYKLGIDITTAGSDWVDDVIIYSGQEGRLDLFKEASTYPRIIYGEDTVESLVDNSTSESINRIEGLYMFAVKGPETVVVDEFGATSVLESAYYDFYIRSCWYEAGAKVPSTISTLMRLYNPDVVKLYPPEED